MSLNNGTGLWVEHQASLLDTDMDTLGTVSTIGTFTSRKYGPRPGLWGVYVRPEDVPHDHTWKFPKIGSAETVEEGIDVLHRHITRDTER